MKWFRRAEKGVVPKKDMRPFLPDAPGIVEAGAHIGIDTVELARTWPSGTVYAFEPVPALFEKLQKKVRGLTNVQTFNLALGARSGTEQIHISEGRSDASSSLLSPKEHLHIHPEVRFEQTIDVETVTLDGWASAQGIGAIDLLWLDLQGYELEALKSAQTVLERVSAVYTEVHLVENYAGAPLYDTLREWLESRGFAVVREELAWADGGNVLFARRRPVPAE